MPVSRRDLPSIRSAIESLYRILEDCDRQQKRWRDSPDTEPRPADGIESAIQDVLRAIMPSGVTESRDCPDIAESELDLEHRAALLDLRERMIGPFSAASELANESAGRVKMLHFLEGVIRGIGDGPDSPPFRQPRHDAIPTEPPFNPEQFARFLELHALATSSERHRVPLATLNEYQQLLTRFGVCKVDGVFVGPPDPTRVPNAVPIANTDCMPIPGTKPLVCPRSAPKLPGELMPRVEERFRSLRLIGSDQTVLWVGRQARPETLCMFREGCSCFPEHAPVPAAGARGGEGEMPTPAAIWVRADGCPNEPLVPDLSAIERLGELAVTAVNSVLAVHYHAWRADPADLERSVQAVLAVAGECPADPFDDPFTVGTPVTLSGVTATSAHAACFAMARRCVDGIGYLRSGRRWQLFPSRHAKPPMGWLPDGSTDRGIWGMPNNPPDLSAGLRTIFVVPGQRAEAFRFAKQLLSDAETRLAAERSRARREYLLPRAAAIPPSAPDLLPPSQGATPPTDPYADLRRFARYELKGQERAVVDALCGEGGEVSIADLAVKEGVGWGDPFQGFKDARRRLNTKLKPQGWRLERRNNTAYLVTFVGAKEGAKSTGSPPD